ncbi:MAG: Rpn family recombination-promoting nuclease/putative transposase, partial [Myxococcaceae bacterium]
MPEPHDALVKWLFTQPERAAEELKAVLPSPLVTALDWATLKVVPGSFVDELLRQRHTDLLFSIQTSNAVPIHLYILFEHQSGVDAMMPFRLLCYVTRVWERWLKENPKARRLPPVVS